MSYLKLEKALMTNLQDSLSRELLRTNRSGAYSCSTIVDCNTCKYHGLLVVPVPELDDENHVLLSSLDPTVIQHGTSFNLGLHKYQGNNFSPQGRKHIRESSCDTVPTTLYRVGGILLKKEVVFQHYEDRILIRYTLLEAHSKTALWFRPFLAFRSVRQFTHENGAVNRSHEVVDNGISMCMYAGYPSLFMQFSKKNEFHFEPYWYRGLEYPKEQEHGYASNEDLYVPDFFEVNISKGESIVFTASTTECRTSTLKNLFDKEVESRSLHDNFSHCLVNIAHQFHNRTKNNERYTLAGRPWFKCRAHDRFIALPGLTLSIEEQDYFELVVETAAKGLHEFMGGKPLSVRIYEVDKPDVPLWCVWSIQQYIKETGKEYCRRPYMGLIRDIVDYFLVSRHPNLTLDTDGLLYADVKGEATTWMNSMNNGQPVVPCPGYIVGSNALWYNVLRFTAAMEMESDNEERANELDALAKKCEVSFVEAFLDEYGYLYDYVDDRMVDWGARPDMVFAVALDYSPLDQKQRRGVLDVCTRELLTPKGLRSLFPKSGGYSPMCAGPRSQHDLAYHQGTAWPWLGGFYLEACLKLYKQIRLSFVERQLVGYEDEMINHCLSTLPELFDGNPPFNGRGAISSVMNVAEVLCTLELLEKYKF